MKLQQLRFMREIARNNLNISQAAENLHTSQSGVSKQMRLLEEELGLSLFQRKGKHLNALTAAGEAILSHVEEILLQTDAIAAVAAEYRDPARGQLSIATTHTQSRYMLPPIIRDFTAKYPEVGLHMHQGSPMQISQLAVAGTADFAIATEALELFSDLVMLPCFRWNRSILLPMGHPLLQDIDQRPHGTPTQPPASDSWDTHSNPHHNSHTHGTPTHNTHGTSTHTDPIHGTPIHSTPIPVGHPLSQHNRPTLSQLAQYPLVTYVHGFTGRSKLDRAFTAAGLEPKVVFTAVDADVIKTYVRLGLGVGIIASMALEAGRDDDLVAIDASHLFEESTTNIAFRQESFLRGYMYDFIEMFAPHLTRELVEEAVAAKRSGKNIDFSGMY